MALTEDEFDNKNDATTLDNEEVDEIEDDFFTDDDAELERRMVTPKCCVILAVLTIIAGIFIIFIIFAFAIPAKKLDNSKGKDDKAGTDVVIGLLASSGSITILFFLFFTFCAVFLKFSSRFSKINFNIDEEEENDEENGDDEKINRHEDDDGDDEIIVGEGKRRGSRHRLLDDDDNDDSDLI